MPSLIRLTLSLISMTTEESSLKSCYLYCTSCTPLSPRRQCNPTSPSCPQNALYHKLIPHVFTINCANWNLPLCASSSRDRFLSSPASRLAAAPFNQRFIHSISTQRGLSHRRQFQCRRESREKAKCMCSTRRRQLHLQRDTDR